MNVEFFQTAMGRAFYERDVPALVRELSRLNDILAQMVAAQAAGPVVRELPGETEPS